MLKKLVNSIVNVFFEEVETVEQNTTPVAPLRRQRQTYNQNDDIMLFVRLVNKSNQEKKQAAGRV